MAKSAAMGSPSELLWVTATTTTSLPQYTKELRWAKSEGATRLPQGSGTPPFEDLEIDFTDVTNCRGTKYLLILLCTYSGWVEAFPIRTEKSHEVAKVLLREIIPCYGIPRSIQSDNGPAVIVELLQTVTTAMGINWRLHTAYRPQSSGKVELMNCTLKETLAKLHQETSVGWVDLLPLAILRAHCTPGKSGFSPFKIMFGRPPCLLTSLPGDIRHLGFSSLQNQMAALGKVLTDVRAYILERAPISLEAPVHPFIPGDQVWVKDWKHEPAVVIKLTFLTL
ncbi:hypothetical protein mRhiFer1_007894 [Rhinolophus ferrumequinum]|uniref:Integrase catalytic domain-containing protein n=1 Tax=Rhinolophus ferrumequinum TaxID=59479 RepID=A0A7J8AW23_RHIFE|nr:hypothetical protein mRhiFer1_007894 [Rhinolophus ferrumequinum]